MKSKSSIIAQKLVNLYRQGHVILGGWSVLNPIFLEEATPDVIREMHNIPTSKFLIQHIENLRSGKTPIDSIDPDLLPYGGMMTESQTSASLSETEWRELENALERFTPTQEGLNIVQNLGFIKRFGDDWLVEIRSALSAHPELFAKWELVTQTYHAYSLWTNAMDIVQRPITDRVRAQLQADMPEYETYLPMFGDAGNNLLNQLRTLVTTMHHDD